ncbi:FkbM family methyltransferase [Roseovarius sp. SCSIO 43702]|uniref:FkbM family methyltransferase n=1 Tax=Roseovarius sp. SCSIO 43702 TaxID=2823043 RepID=UPI001C73AAEC|nr:FkbM family methyltransferase [Roseovarius sp. SCSIO 43702]QYX57544.1 FkbM family methyltransferase [Roseovarius sp. SCSIO 43702]
MEIITSRGVQIPVDPAVIQPKVAKKLRKEFYETPEAVGLPRFVTQKDRVLEIGAGIGFISTYLAAHIAPQSITCVEANPVLADYIRRVHELNGVTAEVHNAVLLPDNADMPRSGTVPFHVTEPFWSSSFENPKDLPSTLVDAPVRRLSAMIRECDPTVIICDIEGGEASLFEEVDFGNVRHIYVEVHRRYIGANGVRKMFHDLHRHDFAYSPRASESTQVLFMRISEEQSDW